jgi:hypothetical protein
MAADLVVEQVEDAAAEDDRVAGGGREARPRSLVETAENGRAEARVLAGVELGAALDQPGPAEVTPEGARTPRRRDLRVVGGEDELGVEPLRGAEQRPQRVGAAGAPLEGAVGQGVKLGPGRPAGQVAAAGRRGGEARRGQERMSWGGGSR